jgi:hypothetical protein
MAVFAFGTSIDYFLIFPNPTRKTEEIAEDSHGRITKTTIVPTTGAPHDIPKVYFMVLGIVILILILLAPMLRKAKIGPMELEL